MKKNNHSLKSKAYKIALKFKKFEEEVIYAKLEKQGIPEDLAKEVAMNVVLERNKQNKKDLSYYKEIELIMIVISVLASIVIYIITGRFSFAVQLLSIAIPSTILVHLMTTDK
ncbi:MAG: hypothetical protein JXR05_04635 [Flavobacteriaceae bacterium]